LLIFDALVSAFSFEKSKRLVSIALLDESFLFREIGMSRSLRKVAFADDPTFSIKHSKVLKAK